MSKQMFIKNFLQIAILVCLGFGVFFLISEYVDSEIRKEHESIFGKGTIEFLYGKGDTCMQGYYLYDSYKGICVRSDAYTAYFYK